MKKYNFFISVVKGSNDTQVVWIVFDSMVKHLTHYQTTNFRLFQTERVCRRQFQIWQKWQKVIKTGRKTLWEKEKLLVTSKFSFSHSVFKRLVSQGCQKVSLSENGLRGMKTNYQQCAMVFFHFYLQSSTMSYSTSEDSLWLVCGLLCNGENHNKRTMMVLYHSPEY